MDNCLIFSHKQKIKCCTLLNSQTIIIVCDSKINVFDIGKTKTITQCKLSQQVMPIALWVIIENNKIIVQGKMGYNFIYTYNVQNAVLSLQKIYKSQICGFCKMIQIVKMQLLGISQQLQAIMIFDLQTGKQMHKFMYFQQQYCQSITCLAMQQNQGTNSDMIIYSGQQGNKIFKNYLHNEGEDKIAQCVDQICIKSNQQIKIIQSLQFSCGKLYCILRKNSNLYILQTSPKLQISQTIDFKFSMPRHLKETLNKQLSFIASDKNKVILINANTKTLKILLQIKQSKLVECLSVAKQAICGCTQEKQFFHIEL